MTVSWAELHKLGVVISYYRNKRKAQTKGYIGFALTVIWCFYLKMKEMVLVTFP